MAVWEILMEMERFDEYKAMHEENFLSSWLREHGKSKTTEDKEVREDVKKVRSLCRVCLWLLM